jgi:hypothetical protein
VTLTGLAEAELDVQDMVTRLTQVMSESGGQPYSVAYGYITTCVDQLTEGKLSIHEMSIRRNVVQTALNLYRVKVADEALKESRRGVQRYRGSLTEENRETRD